MILKSLAEEVMKQRDLYVFSEAFVECGSDLVFKGFGGFLESSSGEKG
jgi:hypothetical protein